MFVVLFSVSPFDSSSLTPAKLFNRSLPDSILQYVSAAVSFIYAHSPPLKVYPETKGVPLEEMDVVFGEGRCLLRKCDSLSDFSSGQENKDTRYFSGGGLINWIRRTFTKDSLSSVDNRTRTFTERESYAPLREDHDHDDDDDVQYPDENDGEDYEMIKRNSGS